jgi:hypothetical protein
VGRAGGQQLDEPLSDEDEPLDEEPLSDDEPLQPLSDEQADHPPWSDDPYPPWS